MMDFESFAVGTHRAPCPECNKGARDNAMGVTITAPGEGVYHCYRCHYSGRIGGKSAEGEPREIRVPIEKPDRTERVLALIKRSGPIRGTVAERYLAGRGIAGGLFDDTALRFLPDAFHHPTKTKHPCMIGVITNILTAEIQAVHQTFLAEDGSGKADVERPRLFMGPTGGGAIRLTADEDVTYGLAIAEGIETAFAGIAAGYPTWSVMDAGGITRFPLLAGIESLTILADADEAGTKAAHACANTWRQRETRIITPVAGDWNDQTRKILNG